MSSFIQETIHKVKRHTLGRISYLLKYRPTTIIENIDAYFSTDVYDELFKFSNRYRLEYLYEKVIGEQVTGLLKKYGEANSRGELVAKISGGRVYTDEYNIIVVYNRENEVISDLCFYFEEIQPGVFGHSFISLESIDHYKAIDLPKYFDATVCCLMTGGSGIGHFAHWMLDVLPRIKFVQDAGWFDEVDYFWVPNYEFDFQRETLAKLGISEDRIINGRECRHVIAREMIVTNSPSFPMYNMQSWKLKFLRDLFRQFRTSVPANHPSNRYYISRQDANHHKIKNEDQVIQILESFGFRSLSMSEYSIQERANLFAQAEAIVSPTGAGMMSMLFCPDQVKILEIFTQNYVDPFFTEMALQAGFDYEYIICPDDTDKNYNSVFDIYSDDVSISIPMLVFKLQTMGLAPLD